MDPQQRLLMTYSYLAIEDAGYPPESLSGSKTGVFIGTASSGYRSLMAKTGVAIEGYTSTGTVPSVGPNRLSYFLNLHGPSEPIETACSSSLVAIHRAVQAIESGSCEAAIVGGVNTIITPDMHIGFNMAGMLCEDGRCKTFSSKANGYVRGEGVGVLFLKPLNRAESDGDHIYAVIRGSSENHGGKANSLTAPNPKAQAELLKSAYTKAGIDPKTVSYIEAHGTGTELGDPIEINGLKTAFKSLVAKAEDASFSDPHCGLGSVKSNIGHLELAAGVAGVIKVLLQLKHKTLVKTLHCQDPNPYIELTDSPFYMVQENREWTPLKDDLGRDIPRRAGVSSFGFGGVNAHVVLEEYISPNSINEPSVVEMGPTNSVIVPLSAKSLDRLNEGAKNLLRFLQNQPYTETGDNKGVNLANLSYTLQVGREAMEERLGLIVSSLKELEEKLEGFLEGKDDIDDLYKGRVNRNQNNLSVFTADEDLQKAMDSWITKGKHAKLLDLWVKGLTFDWNKLYDKVKPKRISLPTYPFLKERHWIPETESRTLSSYFPDLVSGSVIHPLLHQNTSDLSEQRFSSTFSGKEFFLKDHRVNGQKVLPGVGYLEMARAAVEKAVGQQEEGTSIQLKNVVWTRPITVNNHHKDVHIALFEESHGQIQYEVYTASEKEEEVIVHSQGVAEFKENGEVFSLDLENLRSQMKQGTISAETCYQAFKTWGLGYGPGHQAIQEIYQGEEQILATLILPFSIQNTLSKYVLHPSLMDAAFQSSIGLMLNGSLPPTGSKKEAVVTDLELRPSLPFALESLEILGSLSKEMLAWVRNSDESASQGRLQKLDIDLCDERGNVCVKMRGFSSRILDQESKSYQANDEVGTLLTTPQGDTKGVEPKTIGSSIFKEKATDLMKGLLASTLKMPAHRVQTDEPLGKYGIDSMMAMNMTHQLEKTFGSLSKTLFFEYQTIDELTQYFTNSHKKELHGLLSLEESIIKETESMDSLTSKKETANRRSGRRRLFSTNKDATK